MSDTFDIDTVAQLDRAHDPFELFEIWYDAARVSEPNDPNAMAVATVDNAGFPNIRMVLLKDLDATGTKNRGFVFYTNFEGAKGRELLAAPKAALLFHWKSLERQIRIRGAVSLVTSAEADAYFASRPRLSQVGAWASQQSRPLEARAVLEDAIARYSEKFGTGSIPRPPYWSGFRVTPFEIEFWLSRPFRLHDRAVFRLASDDAAWTKTRLFP